MILGVRWTCSDFATEGARLARGERVQRQLGTSAGPAVMVTC